jgi:nucleotide-binding universal stress UspA family protein
MNPDIKRIVVPIDFSASSEAAARFACDLARKLEAHLYLIHVVGPSRLVRHGPNGSGPTGWELARAKLATLRQQLGAAEITIEVRTGSVDEAITSAVIAYGVDLIVMATHGRSGVPHLLFGSVAEQVIRTAPCPVLVMRDSGKIRVHIPASRSVEDGMARIA